MITYPFTFDQLFSETRNVLDLLVLIRMPSEFGVLIDQLLQI